jgi:hypothetical protein
MADETKTPPVDPKVKDAERKKIKDKEREVSLAQRLLDIATERGKIEDKLATYREETLKDYETITTVTEQTSLMREKEYELNNRLLLQEKQAHEELLELGVEISQQRIKDLETAQDTVDKLKDQAKEGRKLKKALNDISSSATHVLEKFTGINGKAQQLAKSVEAVGGYGNYFKKQMGLVSKKITHANVNAAMMLKLYEKTAAAAKKIYEWTGKDTMDAIDITSGIERAIKRQDEMRLASRDVAALSSQEMRQYSSTMKRLGQETDGTTEDFVRINKEMYNTSNVFREMKNSADPAREGLQKFAHTLQRRLNIPIADTATLVDKASHVLGIGTNQIEGFSASLLMTGKSMGLNVNKIIPEFSNQLNNLAKWNLPDARGQFLELAKAAQLTGVGVDSIVGSMENFSTFEGAATAASKLNAVFGTTMDSFEMMDSYENKGPLATLIKFRESMENAGKDMSDVGQSEMRVLKSVVGLTEAQIKSFGNISMQQLQGISAKTKNVAEAESMLAAGRKDGMTTQELQKNVQDNMTTSMDKYGKMADDTNKKMLRAVEGMEALAGSIKMVGMVFGTFIIGKVVAGIFGALLPALGTAVKGWLGVAAAAETAAATQAAASGGAFAAAGAAIAGAFAVGAAAIGGGYIGHKINEKIYGEGNVDYGFATFDGGSNSAPKGTAVLNENRGTEKVIDDRAWYDLAGGERIEKTPPGPEAGEANAINFTLNLVTKEGKNLSTFEKLLRLNPITGVPMLAADAINGEFEKNLNLIFND